MWKPCLLGGGVYLAIKLFSRCPNILILFSLEKAIRHVSKSFPDIYYIWSIIVNTKFRFCSALAVLALAVGTASAVPYASKIRAAATEFNSGTGTDISYILNQSSDSVTIEVRDSSTSATVATFAGATDRGANTVSWNGTVDNASGAAVPAGSYAIVITADNNNTAWEEITSMQSSPLYSPTGAVYGNVFKGFSPNDVLVYPDPSSDFFGDLYVTNSVVGSAPIQGHVLLRADLAVADGTDGYESRILREATLDGAGHSYTLWWGDFDPENPDIIYKAGQSNPAFWYGDLNSSATLISADPTFGQDPAYMLPYSPRSVVVVMEGTEKYAYFATDVADDIDGIFKAPMIGNELSGAPVRVSSFSAGRYALGLDTDSDGNLYFVSRYTDSVSGAGGSLLRWNKADTLGANPTLSESNAVWNVDGGSGMLNMHGPAISPTDGNVYVFFTDNTFTTLDNGAYLVGNVSEATLTKTLTTADRVVDTPSLQWATNPIAGTVRCDPAGNLMIIDRKREQIRMYTPGGQSSMEIPAPTSQALTITPASNVGNWDLY